MTAAGQSSELVALRGEKLIWRGALPREPTRIEVAYTAVSKGLYELSVPPGGILDRFEVLLTANGSDPLWARRLRVSWSDLSMTGWLQARV